MKTTMRIAAAVITAIAMAVPVFAEFIATDTKGMLIWSFLGFCVALIVIIPDDGTVRKADDKNGQVSVHKSSQI